MNEREYTKSDHFLMQIDQALRTVFGKPQVTERPNPAQGLDEPDLDAKQRSVTTGLMRVNHTGEVCAQALYQGQALTAHLSHVRESMERAAEEENDHLDWCQGRIQELGGHVSYLNPFWYVGSFTMGAVAGFAGDKWSLGFVAETERQVVKHLESHLKRIPSQDGKSHAILKQMKIDEGRHATHALEAGAAELPKPIKVAMTLTSKLMTGTSYWF